MHLEKVNLFAGHSAALDALTDDQKEGIYSIIWSYRTGEASAAVYTYDRDILLSITGGIGSDMPQGSLYAVDLESIGTDKIRIYVDPREDHTDNNVGIGYYYTPSGEVTEYKEYFKNYQTAMLTIKRYKADGTPISTETEVPATASHWKGSQALLQIAKDNEIPTVFWRKSSKDQCYMVVRFDVDEMTN